MTGVDGHKSENLIASFPWPGQQQGACQGLSAGLPACLPACPTARPPTRLPAPWTHRREARNAASYHDHIVGS